jgi:diguanylate cyclase
MNDKCSSEKHISSPVEFSDSFGGLIISSIQDLKKSISVDDHFAEKLNNLESEVRKGFKVIQGEFESQRRTAVVLAQKLEQSEANALVDPLTNVLNRAAYNMRIRQMVEEFKRYKEEWALLILDIDHFKKFNDDFGHHLGDMVLKSVAGTVKNSIRGSDRVFRYGGEEFVVLLGRVNAKIANQLAEKICREVEREYINQGNKKLKVTLSIGGTIITTSDTELSIFQRADKAMYSAKNNGRNQVMMDF